MPSFSDPTNDTVKISFTNLPNYATYDEKTNSIVFTNPPPNNLTIDVKLTDQFDLSISKQIKVSILPMLITELEQS